jgi:PAS domain S-box-containing protein
MLYVPCHHVWGRVQRIMVHGVIPRMKERSMSSKPEQRKQPFGFITRSPYRWQILIGVTTVIALLFNLFSLERGEVSVSNHLLYIPIIIAAYAYPRKGTLFALIISGVYLLMVYGFRSAYPEDLFSASVRFYMFVLVGVVVSYLSLRLKKEEQKYHRIFEQSYTGIFLCDPSTHTVIQANQHAEDILGYTPEELIGMPISRFFSEFDMKLLARSCSAVVKNPNIQLSYEFTAQKKDVTEIHVSLSLSGIPDEGGACEYVIILIQDITERCHAEMVIRQQAAAMKTSRDGMAILGTTGETSYVNDAFCSLFGYPDSRGILGFSLDRFFAEGEWQRFDEEILPVLERDFQWRGEMTGKCRDTTTFPVEISLGRIEGGGIFCIVHTISERKRALQALGRVNRKLSMLSTITRHDITNQIFTILGYIHIAKDLGKEGKVYPYLEKIEGSMRVINDRIAFTGNYQDMGISPPTWQDLNGVFLYAISHLDLGSITRKTSITGISVFADPMLEKALFNLVKNTVLHAKTATEIRFFWQESPQGLILVYEDNGTGIAPGKKESIFAPDIRPTGGFGLFFVQEILALTEITIEETGKPGIGARFEMTVPKGSYRFAESSGPVSPSLSQPGQAGTGDRTTMDTWEELP